VEAPTAVRPRKVGHLKFFRRDLTIGPTERSDTRSNCFATIESVSPILSETFAGRFSVAPNCCEVTFIDHGSVVKNVEHLITVGNKANFGDKNFDLHGLHLVRKDCAEHLRVAIGQTPSIDIVA